MKNIISIFSRKNEVEPTAFTPEHDPNQASSWQPEAPVADIDTPVDENGQIENADELADDELNAEDLPTESAEPELSEAEKQAEEANQALDAAYEQGRTDALAEANAQIEVMQQNMAQSIAQLTEAGEQLQNRYRAEAVSLASTIAKAVVGVELQSQPDQLTRIVQRAMQGVPEGCSMTICCHPDDYDVINAHLPALQSTRTTDVAIAPQDDVERGGCVIKFDDGAVDAQPSVAVDVFREAIQAELAGQPAPKTEP